MCGESSASGTHLIAKSAPAISVARGLEVVTTPAGKPTAVKPTVGKFLARKDANKSGIRKMSFGVRPAASSSASD